MLEWLLIALPVGVLWPLIAVLAASLPASERVFVRWLLLAHGTGVAGIVLITQYVYGSGDMLAYHRIGGALAEMVRDDMSLLPELGALVVNQPSEFDGLVFGQAATVSMFGIAAFLELVFFGSLPAVCAAVAMLSASGKLAMYNAFRCRFAPAMRSRLAFAVMLIPSFVFWSSGILKEGIAVGGLGWVVWAIAPWIGVHSGRRHRLGLLVLAPAATLVALTKPYLLFPLVLAAAASWFVARQRRQGALMTVTPLRLVLAVAVAAAMTAGLDVLFPRYSTDSFVEQAASIREMGTLHLGGSSFAPTGPSGGLLSHLLYSPLAIINVLFRPVLFEARSLLVAVSALETTAFLVLFWRRVAARGARRIIFGIVRDPGLVFCAVYVLVFSIAVGFSTTNFGTLARYRSPMLPFLGLLLLGLSGWQARATSPSHRPDGARSPHSGPQRRPSRATTAGA